MKKSILPLMILLIYFSCLSAQDNNLIHLLQTPYDVSFRGISIPDNKTCWISGSNSLVGITKDSGSTFEIMPVIPNEMLDFRAIHALNDSEALVVNVGSPATIFKTADGRKTWNKVYQNALKEIFFDGLCFWDKQHGIAFSDPVDHHFYIVTTHDGGETWQHDPAIQMPACFEGEAAFASSGTGIWCGKNGKVIIGSGGSHARLFISEDFGLNWQVRETPMICGKESTGIFSVFMNDQNRIFIAGGDYKKAKKRKNNYFFSDDNGQTWNKPKSRLSGYCSCLLYINPDTILATGEMGTDLSSDGGLSWHNIDKNAFQVAGKFKDSQVVILAGKKGRIGVFKPTK